jgi:collagenase-like PrtC family protease
MKTRRFQGLGRWTPADDDPFLLEEHERPGELMPIEEDEHGTYILNSKDLRAAEHVPRLMEIGVDSLKIEGRTKVAYYVARSCQAYRRAIDDASFEPLTTDARATPVRRHLGTWLRPPGAGRTSTRCVDRAAAWAAHQHP